MQYGIKEVLDLTILDYATKEPVAFVDYALSNLVETEAERTHITGGRGQQRLLSFDSEKTTELTLTIPLVDLSLLARIAGNELIQDSDTDVITTERVTVRGGEIKLSNTPIGEAEAYEIKGLRDFGEKLDVTWEDTTGQVSEVADGTDIFIIYTHAAVEGTKEVKVLANAFPKEVMILCSSVIRRQSDGLDYPIRMTAHKCRPRADFSLTMEGSDPTELEIVFDVSAVRNEQGDAEYISILVEDE